MGPIKVRVINPALLPKQYLNDPEVLEVLRKVVARDIRENNAPIPAGVETYRERLVAGIAG